MTNRQKGVIYAVTPALMWSILAIILKVALSDLDAITVSWLRFFIAFLLLSIIVGFSNPGYFKIIKSPPLTLIVAAVALGFNYLGFIKGLDYTSPTNAQVFIQVGPVLLALSGIFIYKEKIKPKQLIGLILAVVGLLIFYSQQIQLMIETKSVYNRGVLWVLFGAFSWAVYAVLQKGLVKNYETNQLNLVIYGLPILFYLPFVDLSPIFSMSWPYLIIVLFLGVNTLVAYTFVSLALKYLEANIISVIITVNPIFTFILMGILAYFDVNWIKHESFTTISILGAFCVLLGAVLTIMFSRERKRFVTPKNSETV